MWTASSSRSRSRMGNDQDVQPGEWPAVIWAVSSMRPETDRRAVLEPVDVRQAFSLPFEEHSP